MKFQKIFSPFSVSILLSSLCFIFVAFSFPMEQLSDFLLYQNAALDFRHYIKGGMLPVFYAPFLRLGLPSFLAALVINLASFLLLSTVFPRNNKYSPLIFLCIGFALSAWSPIINSDVPSICLIIAGAVLLVKNRLPLGFIFLAFGLSMRMSSIVISFLLLAGLIGFSFRFSISKVVIVSLALSILLAVGIDSLLKIQSIESLEISKSQRVHLYAGFIATSQGSECGNITPLAKEMMIAEQNEPILSIIRIPDNFGKIVLCKWKKMLLYSASASLWLRYFKVSFPWSLIFVLEMMMTFLMKFICSLFLIVYRKLDPLYCSALIIFLGSIALHTFVEIQPRYMIPPLLSSITLMLFLSESTNEPKDTRLPLG